MTRVSTSHAPEDIDAARGLAAELRRDGLEVWLDDTEAPDRESQSTCAILFAALVPSWFSPLSIPTGALGYSSRLVQLSAWEKISFPSTSAAPKMRVYLRTRSFH